MFVKHTFALFFACAAMAAPGVFAGGIRGVIEEDDFGIVRGRRHLKDENKVGKPNKNNVGNRPNNNGNNNNGNNNNANPAEPVVLPEPVVVTPAPLSGVNLWRANCSGNLQSCAGGFYNACSTCLYAQSLLKSSNQVGRRACAINFCRGCVNEAFAFYDCGLQAINPQVPVPPVTPVVPVGPAPQDPGPAPVPEVSNPVISPVPEVSNPVPVPNVPAPIVPAVPSVDSQTTSIGCPQTQPARGADCTGLIPDPFLYHKCVYGNQVCSCRKDSPYYLCNEAPPAPKPAPVPVTPVPVPVTPVPVPVTPVPVPVTSVPVPVTPVPVPVTPVPVPITSAPVPEGTGIPSNAVFNVLNPSCPASITNCAPCSSFLQVQGGFEGSCETFAPFNYEGTTYSNAKIQCRCYTQDNPDPSWDCRWIAGSEQEVIVNASPSCSNENDFIATPDISVGVDPTPDTPVDPAPETPVDPVPETPVDPAPETPVDPVPETPVDPVPETPVDPVPEPPVNPVPVPVTPAPVTPVIPSPVASPTAGPISEGTGIPSNAVFNVLNPSCPASITNCAQCSSFLQVQGGFEGSCETFAPFNYEGTTYSNAKIQCRCYTQDNPDPSWDCRWIAGSEQEVIVNASPSCSNENDFIATPDISVGVDPAPETPALITTIPETKTCLKSLPTSGLSTCALPADAICCHNVQIANAKVCTCVDGYFQCRDGVPSDCPDDQNPNVFDTFPDARPLD